MITERNSVATPGARTKNKRACYLSTLAHLAALLLQKPHQKKAEIHHPDASSPSRRLVVSFRRFYGSGCGEGGMGYMGRVQQQETSAEYDVGGRKSPPTQARRRREGT